MALMTKSAVLVCCILKALSVLCLTTSSDNGTLPTISPFTSPTQPQTTQPVTQPSSTTASPSTTSSPSTTASPSTTSSTSTTNSPTSSLGSNIPVQCNYTSIKFSTDNSSSSATDCVCPGGFISVGNLTCIKETDLTPMNIILAAVENNVNVTWSYQSLSPWDIFSMVKVNISGNTSEITTNGTFHSIRSSVPGQRVSITIIPVINGDPILLPAAILYTAFRPAMPGALIDPVGGYHTPNATIQWNKSYGHVDKYQISLILLCPTGASPMKFMSSQASVLATSLKPGREYRLMITAVSGNVTSVTRTIASIITKDIVPDPPTNVSTIPPIQTTSVRLAIDSDLSVECPSIYYQATVLYRVYHDEVFTEAKKTNLSVNQTYHTIGNLVPGAMYIVDIVTKNRDFTSNGTFNVTFRTAESAPGNVQNIRIVDKSDSSIRLRIDRPSEPNGEITGYVLRVSSQSCQVLVMSLTAEFNCSKVQSLQFQRQNGTQGNCLCTAVDYDGSLEFVVRNLLPYTNYNMKVKAHNSAGAGREAYKYVATEIGAPHTPQTVNISNINSNDVTITWTYGRLTGPTNFSLKITDEVLHSSRHHQCFQARPTNTRCKATGLNAYWKYSFVVVAKTAVSDRTSSVTEKIITLPSAPGPVLDLVEEKQNGDDCTEDEYGVTWTEPKPRDRHGLISKYFIRSSLPKHRHMTELSSTTSSNVYEDTEKKYTVLFAKAGNMHKIFNVSVTAVIRRGLKSEPRTVTIEIPMCSPGLSSGVTAAVIILVLICITVITILLVLLYRWNMFPCQRQTRTFSPRRVASRTSHHIKKDRPFVLRNIKQLVDQLKRDSGRLLILEWDDLNAMTPEYPSELAKLPMNSPKNRYNNILPYDQTRVKLCGDGNDYINANYIPGFKFEREYIACQGPLPDTIVDFWQMVWEQDVPIIVMLTRCQEGTTVKCEQYWPGDLHEPESYGTVDVTRTVEQQNDEYVYSEFTISSADHEKKIKHFHFLEWPDFGAEVDFNVFLDFLFKVKGEIHDDLIGPIVVHCSAGVGRTGTYLAVDYLTEFVRTHNLSSEFDIFQHVLKMRQHRTKMVQAKEQYLFIHECLRELVNRQTTVENHSNDGLQMPSEEEYSEQLFDPEDKLMIEEDNDSEDYHDQGYENPSMTTEL